MESEEQTLNGRHNDLVGSPRQRMDKNYSIAKLKLQVDRLNFEWNLRLEIPSDGESPDKRSTTIEKRCVGIMKYLCFKDSLDEPFQKFMAEAEGHYCRWVKKPKAERGVIPERTRRHTIKHSISDSERLELLQCLHQILKEAQTAKQIAAGFSPGRSLVNRVVDDSPVHIGLPLKKRRSDVLSEEASAKKTRTPGSRGSDQGTGPARDMPPPTRSKTDVPRTSAAASFTSHASSVFSLPASKDFVLVQTQSTMPDDQDLEADIQTQPNTRFSSPYPVIQPQSSEYDGASSFEQYLKDSTASLDHAGNLPGTSADLPVSMGSSTALRDCEGPNPRLQLLMEGLKSRLKAVFPSLPPSLKSASFRVVYEVTRVFLHANLAMNSPQLSFASIANTENYDILWRYLKNHPTMKGKSVPEKSSKDAWDAAASTGMRSGTRAVLLAGSLLYNDGTPDEPFFQLSLQPLKLELSHRLSRRFGADRFLEIDMPHISNSHVPSALKELGETGQELLIQWLVDSDHWLLGRKWKPFHLKPKDRNSKKRVLSEELTTDAAETAHRLYFFAVDCCNLDAPTLPQIGIPQLLDKVRITRKNEDESYLKLFARTDLAVSKTTPTVLLEKSQIRYSDDIRCNGEVMTDGGGRLSPALAYQVARVLGLTYQPSGFQARIGEAKGFWSVDYADRSKEIWIELFKSQRKWHRSRKDRHDDPSDRTFEVLRYSGPLKPADLNVQFLPLLTQRARNPVQMTEVLVRLLEQGLERELSDLRAAMDHPQTFRRWLRESSRGINQRLKHGFVPFRASLPISIEERLNMMLDAGFSPKNLRFVHDLARIAFKNKCDTLQKKLNITVGQSTYAYMVPDFARVLEPDEVYINFSSFTDVASGISGVSLNGIDILVARSPAHHVSDIQKVKAVFKVELMELKDVIVFPTKGNPSLAAKLSGGDYDGDIAWVCWDSEIVENFTNANVPTKPDLVKEGYISKDKTTYGELVHDQPDPVSFFLKKAFKFNMQQSMLGLCTDYKENVCYHLKSVDTQESLYLSTLLSDLVDQAKQGYSFTNEDFSRFKLKVIKVIPRIPSYKTDHVNPSSDHIIDRLKIAVGAKIEEVLTAYWKSVTLSKWDEDLVQCYKWARDKTEPQWRLLVDQLDEDIRQLKSDWKTEGALEKSNRSFTSFREDDSRPEYMTKIDRFYERFQAIKPRDCTTPLTQCLLLSYLPHESLSSWALLRASALFYTYRKFGCTVHFPWFMAGRELARLKAESGAQPPHSVTPSMFVMLKPDSRFVNMSVCQAADDEGASVINEEDIDNLED